MPTAVTHQRNPGWPSRARASEAALGVVATWVDGYPQLRGGALRIGALVTDLVCEAVLEAVPVFDVEVVMSCVLDDSRRCGCP